MQRKFSTISLSQRGICAAFLMVACLQTGCAEGPLWKMGRYSPWVQEKWAAEEQLVETVYSKRERLREIAAAADSLTPEVAHQYAAELTNQYQNEQTLVVKVETIRTLGKLQTKNAESALAFAVKDPEAEVRIAAVQALKHRTNTEQAIVMLREVVGTDIDNDVRREALRSLGKFSGDGVVQTLASVLKDRDPATQYRAIESLRLVTGKNFGPNITAWQEYLDQTGIESPANIASNPKPDLR